MPGEKAENDKGDECALALGFRPVHDFAALGGRKGGGRTSTMSDPAVVWYLVDWVCGDPVLEDAMLEERTDEPSPVVEGLLRRKAALKECR
jgi:hypothetical protein